MYFVLISQKPRVFFPDGSKYEGQRRGGKPHGRGKHSYANGDVYDGEWKADKWDGRGTFYYATGQKQVGRYAADKEVGEAAQWSADGRTAWRVQGGARGEAISLEEAAAMTSPLFSPSCSAFLI